MSRKFPALSIPAAAGIGLRSAHMEQISRELPAAGWLEVHAENFMGHSPQAELLARLRQHYALSIHGVGLSLGSMTGIDDAHLARLAQVCARFEPDLVSEHLAWSSSNGKYLNDLLPLRYDENSLAIVSANIAKVQDKLGRRLLVENLSAYVAFADSTMDEAEFLAALAQRTGCGLLLDVNNVYVSAANLGFDAWQFIDRIPVDAVGEIHLAGHAVNETGGDTVLIDDHGSRVPPAVWSLYARTIAKTGPRPTLIEWDSALPPLDVLLGEAMWADLLAGSLGFRATTISAAGQARPAPGIEHRLGATKPPALMPALAACHAAGRAAHAGTMATGRNRHAHA